MSGPAIQPPIAGLTNYTGSLLQSKIVATAQDLFDPGELSPNLTVGSLAAKASTRISAFVVLAHAQLEEAIETACQSALDRLHATAPDSVAQGWNSFLVHASSPEELARLKLRKGQSYPPAGKMLLQYLAQDYAASVIDRNHGISKKYLISLFSPLGLDLSGHATDISTLTTFAGLRGPVAHTGSGTIQQSSPLSVVNQALAAAAAVDNISSSAQQICAGGWIPSIAPLPPYRSWWRKVLIRLATR